ncbi:hypothetical protein [Paenibacillus piscarius]
MFGGMNPTDLLKRLSGRHCALRYFRQQSVRQ